MEELTGKYNPKPVLALLWTLAAALVFLVTLLFVTQKPVNDRSALKKAVKEYVKESRPKAKLSRQMNVTCIDIENLGVYTDPAYVRCRAMSDSLMAVIRTQPEDFEAVAVRKEEALAEADSTGAAILSRQIYWLRALSDPATRDTLYPGLYSETEGFSKRAEFIGREPGRMVTAAVTLDGRDTTLRFVTPRDVIYLTEVKE